MARHFLTISDTLYSPFLAATLALSTILIELKLLDLAPQTPGVSACTIVTFREEMTGCRNEH